MGDKDGAQLDPMIQPWEPGPVPATRQVLSRSSHGSPSVACMYTCTCTLVEQGARKAIGPRPLLSSRLHAAAFGIISVLSARATAAGEAHASASPQLPGFSIAPGGQGKQRGDGESENQEPLGFASIRSKLRAQEVNDMPSYALQEHYPTDVCAQVSLQGANLP